MTKEIIINTTPEETRIAIVDEGQLVEFYIESPDSERTVGDIFLGHVDTIRSNLQAAFVDIGENLHGFLHFSDLSANLEQQLAFVKERNPRVADFMKTWTPKEEKEPARTGHSSRRRWGDPSLLSTKQPILVTVTKEPYHSKSSRLSTDISLAGRFLVLIPFANYAAVSRRIEDRKERYRLRSIVRRLRPSGFGLIARTVAEGRKEDVLETDLQLLLDRWHKVEKGLQRHSKPPLKLYEDVGLASSIIRDLFSDDFSRVLVDNHRMYRAIRGYIMAVAPHMVNVVKQHKGKKAVFAAARIQDQINELFETKVQLPSGGSVIIEATEAMYVIDVNSGRTRGKQNAEKTALRVNLEAVEVIARQIRLRDLSGLIVVDFIDLRHESNRKQVDELLAERLATDRVTSHSLPMSDYGIVQITRERKRVSVTATHRLANKSRIDLAPPPDPDKIAKNIKRWLGKHDGGDLHLHVHPLTAAWLEHGSWRRTRKSRWQRQFKHRIKVVGEKSLRPDEFRFLDAKSGHDITDLSPRMVRIKAASDRDASEKPKTAPRAKGKPNTNGQPRRKQQPQRTADKT